MKKLMFVMGILVVLGMLFMSCDDKKNTTNPNPNPNAGTIVITVGAGTNPQYSWPGGNVFSVSVVRTSAPATPIWSVVTAGVDNIVSPVTHGTVPAGAIEAFNTETTLSAGVGYRVTVSRVAGSEFGYTDFTP